MLLQRRNLQDSLLQANNGLQEYAPATQESAGQLLAGTKLAAGTRSCNAGVCRTASCRQIMGCGKMLLQRRKLQDSFSQAKNGLQEHAPATQEAAGQRPAGK